MRLDDLLRMSASTPPQLQAGMVTGAATPPAGAQALAQIRARLDRSVRTDEYMTDAEFAALLRKPLKTLQNQRALEPGRYPQPMCIGGGRIRLHARDEVLDWLAQEELTARSRTVHRCL